MKFIIYFLSIALLPKLSAQNILSENVFQVADDEEVFERWSATNEYQCRDLVKALSSFDGSWSILIDEITKALPLARHEVLNLAGRSVFLKVQKQRSRSFVISTNKGDRLIYSSYTCKYPSSVDVYYADFSMQSPKESFSVQEVGDDIGKKYSFSGVLWFKSDMLYNPIRYDYLNLQWRISANQLTKNEIKKFLKLPRSVRIDKIKGLVEQDCLFSDLVISSLGLGSVEVIQNMQSCTLSGKGFLQQPIMQDEDSYSYSILRDGLYFDDCQDDYLHYEECRTEKRAILRKLFDYSLNGNHKLKFSLGINSIEDVFSGARLLISLDIDDEHVAIDGLELRSNSQEGSSYVSPEPIINSISIGKPNEQDPVYLSELSDFCMKSFQRSHALLRFFGLKLSLEQLEDLWENFPMGSNWSVSKDLKITLLVEDEAGVSEKSCSLPLVWRLK